MNNSTPSRDEYLAKALEDYRKVLELDPDDDDSLKEETEAAIKRISEQLKK